MFKTISFLAFLLFFASCGKSGGGSGSSGASAVSLEEISTDQAVPQAALNFDVNVKLDNFNASQESKVLEASELIKRVIASEEFKDRILNHTYNGKKTFVDNGGLTNAQIYKKILEGSEYLRPGADNEMDLDLEVFARADDTVGYTMTNSLKIFMNTKFLNANEPYEVTTNLMHEWLHKLGFRHAKAKTANRKYSVPYAIGYLMRSLAKKYN